MVARVRRVDRDQGQGAQILPRPEPRRLRRLGRRHDVVGKRVRDAVLVDRDQRHRFRRRRIAQPRDDPRFRQTVIPRPADLLRLDQFALARAGPVSRAHQPVAVGLLVDGRDPPASLALVIDPEDPLRPHADPPDHPRGQRRVRSLERRQPPQQPVPGPERRIVLPRQHQHTGRVVLAVPFRRRRPEIALRIRPRHPQHQHLRQIARRTRPPPLPLDPSVGGHLGQHAFQLDLCLALDAERPRDVALVRQRRIVPQPCEDLVGGGKLSHAVRLSRATGRHTSKIAGPRALAFRRGRR